MSYAAATGPRGLMAKAQHGPQEGDYTEPPVMPQQQSALPVGQAQLQDVHHLDHSQRHRVMLEVVQTRGSQHGNLPSPVQYIPRTHVCILGGGGGGGGKGHKHVGGREALRAGGGFHQPIGSDCFLCEESFRSETSTWTGLGGTSY